MCRLSTSTWHQRLKICTQNVCFFFHSLLYYRAWNFPKTRVEHDRYCSFSFLSCSYHSLFSRCIFKIFLCDTFFSTRWEIINDFFFVTKPCRKIWICRVFCYEGGGGSENPENLVTYYVDVPKYNFIPLCYKMLHNALKKNGLYRSIY
jgi:hypothetical protein